MKEFDPIGPYGSYNGVQIPSAATSNLMILRDEEKLCTASGFFVENQDNFFLVTALHNFTGRHFFTGGYLGSKTPNKFRATLFLQRDETNFDPYILTGNLFEGGEPTFLYDLGTESTEGGDIAILKFPKRSFPDSKIVTMNDETQENWTAYAGLDVTVLGYPSSINASGTPIWKRVSIASEPSQKINERRTVLTDGLTFSGMSGGPVIISQSQGFRDDGNYLLDKKMTMRIIGVYAGRYAADEEKSGSLGFYWPIEIAYSIIAGERKIGDIRLE